MSGKKPKRRRHERAAAVHEDTWSAEECVTRAARHTSNRILFSLVAVTVIAIAFGIWRSQQAAEKPELPRRATAVRSDSLASNGAFHDFGTISMAAGNVSHRYRVRNTGTEQLTISRIYTSCMCTVARLTTTSGRTYGPFGMPGHGFVPPANAPLSPGQEANLEIVFDPAAHGPAGVGRIERIITLETGKARPLELRFVAMVKP